MSTDNPRLTWGFQIPLWVRKQGISQLFQCCFLCQEEFKAHPLLASFPPNCSEVVLPMSL